ncbi:MAG: ABC transporter substrate-binding protein, partial [Luteibacter sp.]
EVWISNHRSVEGILDYIRRLGALVGAAPKAERLADELERGLDATREASARLSRRPRVYFEEWDDPYISGIRWVSELVGIAGGDDVLPHRAGQSLAKDRIVGDDAEIVATAPEIIIGSWCGKRFRPEQVAARAGWENVPAIRNGELHEVKSPLILQPGPAALTDGLAELRRIVHGWAARVA